MDNIIIYNTDDGVASVKLYANDGTVWLARAEITALFQKDRSTISKHMWRQFSDVIDKAKAACDTSKIKVSDHFADVRKIVKAGATSKPIDDYHLSRQRIHGALWRPASEGYSRAQSPPLLD